MNEVMTYRGYVGSVNSSIEDGCLYGKVLGIPSLILYEGNTIKELEQGFHFMVDDYIDEINAREGHAIAV